MKLKRLLNGIVDERTLPIQRKCLLEDIVVDMMVVLRVEIVNIAVLVGVA